MVKSPGKSPKVKRVKAPKEKRVKAPKIKAPKVKRVKAPKRASLSLVKNSNIQSLGQRRKKQYVGVAKDMANLKRRKYVHERTKGINGKMHFAKTTNMFYAENKLMDKVDSQSTKYALKNKMDSGAPEAPGYVYVISGQ